MSHEHFTQLHHADTPLILYNVWDAGSAVAVAKAGATAIATGSQSLAGAQGFDDGQAIPFEALLETTKQIKAAIDLPVSVDFEAGFAKDHAALLANASALHEAGAVGCNFEDQVIGGEGLVPVEEQAERIALVARAGLFVNARTDVFLQALTGGDDPNRDDLIDQAIARGEAYKKAGAGCFFIPGLGNPDMIGRIVKALDMPINVMRLPGMISNAQLAQIGVARISYGPGSWREAMAGVEAAAREAFSP